MTSQHNFQTSKHYFLTSRHNDLSSRHSYLKSSFQIVMSTCQLTMSTCQLIMSTCQIIIILLLGTLKCTRVQNDYCGWVLYCGCAVIFVCNLISLEFFIYMSKIKAESLFPLATAICIWLHCLKQVNSSYVFKLFTSTTEIKSSNVLQYRIYCV